jgi:peroxiredoxin
MILQSHHPITHHPRKKGETVNVGEMVPRFSLPGTTGPGLDLQALRGKGRAALFFYPADRTPG